MSPEELERRHWEIEYKSAYSSRYHRRRSVFLTNMDKLLTLVTLVAGASAFTDLVAGSPGWLAKFGAALVTLISLAQVLLQIGAGGSAHALWMRRWDAIHTATSLNHAPTQDDVRKWLDECSAIEGECVSEFRALRFDCEDIIARVYNIPGRQHIIWPIQRLFIHFGTFQQNFPIASDQQPPVPDKQD